MLRIKEWWLDRSKKWKIVIIVVMAGIVLGTGGTFGLLEVFKRVPRACSFCHSQAVYVDSYYESDFMDNAHAVLDPPVKCKDCHHATLVQLTKELITNVTGNFEDPLETRFYEQEFCLDCHSFEDVKEVTKDDWQDRGLYFDPHESPHVTEEEGYIECQWCHRAHEETWGMTYCMSCHHELTVEACSACHKESFY